MRFVPKQRPRQHLSTAVSVASGSASDNAPSQRVVRSTEREAAGHPPACLVAVRQVVMYTYGNACSRASWILFIILWRSLMIARVRPTYWLRQMMGLIALLALALGLAACGDSGAPTATPIAASNGSTPGSATGATTPAGATNGNLDCAAI